MRLSLSLSVCVCTCACVYDLTNMPRCKLNILGFQMEVVADPASVKVNPNTQVCVCVCVCVSLNACELCL